MLLISFFPDMHSIKLWDVLPVGKCQNGIFKLGCRDELVHTQLRAASQKQSLESFCNSQDLRQIQDSESESWRGVYIVA